MARGPSKRDEKLRMEALVQEILQNRKEEMAEKVIQKDNRQATDYLAKQEFALERMERIAQRFSERKWMPE